MSDDICRECREPKIRPGYCHECNHGLVRCGCCGGEFPTAADHDGCRRSIDALEAVISRLTARVAELEGERDGWKSDAGRANKRANGWRAEYEAAHADRDRLAVQLGEARAAIKSALDAEAVECFCEGDEGDTEHEDTCYRWLLHLALLGEGGIAAVEGKEPHDSYPQVTVVSRVGAVQGEGPRLHVQTACDRCTQGVMDQDNPHLHGLCKCPCHPAEPSR